MNLSDVKDRVFRLTNNIYNDTFHMRDLINSALTILSDDGKIESVQTYQVTAGNATYTLPSGFKSVRALVEGSIDNPSQVYDLVSLDSAEGGYALWGDSLTIKPTPEQDKTLNLYFYKYATQLVNDTDELESQFVGYVDVIASYAAAMILSLPGMDNVTRGLIDRYFSIWEDGKQRFKLDRSKSTKQATVRKVTNW